MKRILAIALSVFIAMGMVPATAQAATSYNNEDVTWLGNSDDYQLTINSMFDHGLREVSIFYSDYNYKVGLVDAKGNFVVPPIYDSIHPQYNLYDGGVVSNDDNRLNPMAAELLFIDGYVQATRDGKMGLLDTNGKEVVPCKYDAVGLPVEGMCRVILNNKLGYWSLKSKKEVVTPKYILDKQDEKTAAGAPRSITPLTDAQALVNPSTTYSANGKQTRLPAWFDFKDGYALVPKSKADSNGLVKAQIIDKNGKEILSDGPYTYHTYESDSVGIIDPHYSGYYGSYDENSWAPAIGNANGYPQFEQYLDYTTISKKTMTHKNEFAPITKTTGVKYVSGVVGPKGVIIPAQYHGEVGTDGVTGANLKIYPDLNIFVTNCAPNACFEVHNQADMLSGTFNLTTGKKKIPDRGHYDPIHHLMWGTHFGYDAGSFIYYADGNLKEYPKAELRKIDENTGCDKGYLQIIDSKGSGLIQVATGKQYRFDNLNGDAYGAISNDGNVLVEKKGKWGVVRISDGKMITPFIYDSIRGHYEESIVNTKWGLAQNAYSRVSSNGKWGLINTKGVEILPCKYASIRVGYKYVVVTDAAGKSGYFSTSTNKFVLPVQEGVPDFDMEFAVLGAARAGNGRLLKNDGTMVDAELVTTTILTSYPGLFDSNVEIDSQLKEGYDTTAVGPEGKFVLPIPEDFSGISSYTIVVGDGKIGYTNCIYLDWVGKSQSSDIQAQLANIQAKKDAGKINASLTYNVVRNPTKLTYKYGDTFQIDGLEVESVDANGTRVKIDNSRIMIMFVNGDDRTKMWSAERGGTGLNYTIPLKKGTNVLKVFVDEKDTGATIDMELVN
ncbi:MAG: hypothetical protein H6Q59_704 [Firmicutes bacterium]|nr:hypothetical protein [Bacillota bacterium]